MYSVGVDIGSTAAKVAVRKNKELLSTFVLPSGWNSKETASLILSKLERDGITINNAKFVATGYGRVSVPFANKVVTEITCHGLGSSYFLDGDYTVIDIGGQDTKVISILEGRVNDFTMNDKCSAGTGKFIEIMANRLGLTIDELLTLSKDGKNTSITSMCTVFAESEVIGLIGQGKEQADIAYGIVDSVATKVKSLCSRHGSSKRYFLSGGFSNNENMVSSLEKKLDIGISSHELGRFTGAIGAAMIAENI